MQIGHNTKLNSVDVSAVQFVGDNPDCIVSDLGAFLGVVPTTTSSIVDRLVKRDVMKRLRTEENRRVVILRLAPKGEEIYNTLHSRRLAVGQKVLLNLSSAERSTLTSLMRKMAVGSSGTA